MLPQGAPRPSKASLRSPWAFPQGARKALQGVPKVFPMALRGVSKAFQGGVHDILDWKRLSRRCPRHT